MTIPALLAEIRSALRTAWGPDTCAPEDIPDWSEANPARGQCANTALIVHDFFGGVLMQGEVMVDGTRVDFHWWYPGRARSSRSFHGSAMARLAGFARV